MHLFLEGSILTLAAIEKAMKSKLEQDMSGDSCDDINQRSASRSGYVF
jgi:hypothetical protein